MSITRPEWMLRGGVLLAPLVIVLASDWLSLPGPASANATLTSETPVDAIGATVIAAPTSLTQAQTRALDWLRTRSPQQTQPNPFLYPGGDEITDTTPVNVSDSVVPSTSSPVAGLVVTGIMKTSAGGVVSIGKHVHRVGDQVKPGLTVHSIDVAAGRVELKAADGSLHTLQWSPW